MTNKYKNVLYIGVTNDLQRRVFEHESRSIKGFTSKYNCQYLIYYECYSYIDHAIEREKEIKKWRREKKDKLISGFNADYRFLNNEIENI